MAPSHPVPVLHLTHGSSPLPHVPSLTVVHLPHLSKDRAAPQMAVMAVIFLMSLFAVSFASLSKQSRIFQIPKIVFFIGKHFGTGVILSTAFVHLLQEAFESLQHPEVRARWKGGDKAGLIILSSLLTIFFIEFVSTSYVYHLHSGHSAPSSLTHSRTNSSEFLPRSLTPKPLSQSPTEGTPLIPDAVTDAVTGTTTLMPSPTPPSAPSPLTARNGQGRSKSFSYGSTAPSVHADTILEGHHRHEFRGDHFSHHNRGLRKDTDWDRVASRHAGNLGQIEEADVHGHIGDDDSCHEGVKIGRGRQIIGILVLQMGIMIHSFVLGLTVSISTGSEFTSLVTAITFHQIFEGLSLGIRISSLPLRVEGDRGFIDIPMLEQTLAMLFAITTPTGILVGLISFGKGDEPVRLRLMQGIMSAISAGMLIYAATVEMIAGDFVMDSTLWRKPAGMQALALGSLALGVAAMALVDW